MLPVFEKFVTYHRVLFLIMLRCQGLIGLRRAAIASLTSTALWLVTERVRRVRLDRPLDMHLSLLNPGASQQQSNPLNPPPGDVRR
jgi:hypothetical protein